MPRSTPAPTWRSSRRRRPWKKSPPCRSGSKGPCLLNVVWGGKTPEIDLREAEALGFKLAIVPGLLLKAAIGACDARLAALKETHIHPAPRDGMTVRAAFDRVGAEEWDAFRTKFRAPEAKRAAE